MDKQEQLTFGQAIKALKQGKHVCRSGWNGKGMFLYLVEGSTVPFENLRGGAKSAALRANKIEGNVNKIPSDRIISGHIDMKAADGSIVVGWLASQTDMLSEDWIILED